MQAYSHSHKAKTSLFYIVQNGQFIQVKVRCYAFILTAAFANKVYKKISMYVSYNLEKGQFTRSLLKGNEAFLN